MCVANKMFVELNKILKVLDKQDQGSSKSLARKPRILSTPSISIAPVCVPSWAVTNASKEGHQVNSC